MAAIGVSASVFNLVSKVLNVPLLNVTTSFVAEEQALIGKGDDFSQADDGNCLSRKLRHFSLSTFPAHDCGLI